ncbi:MAG TPA: D-aminoacylase [Gemmatimonadales bacterium]|nr:D-aminoacylase [Gemmatimonadales bacterium]
MPRLPRVLLGILVVLAACRPAPAYDLVIRRGMVYDGSGQEPRAADVAVLADSIVAVGDLGRARGRVEVDAAGLAVAPGFINMLSWANEDLLVDGRSQGDIRQGVTLEIFGEGASMGPLTDSMRARMLARQGDLRYDVPWTTLGEYLDHVVSRGIAPNVASFVGATTLRVHEVGYVNRPATPAELGRMQDLVRQAMAEGALGVGSSLIYAPANYATTDELIALAAAAGESGGMYISHMRDEGRGLLTATRELITIAREANVPAEIYHLKASGRPNWAKLDTLIALIDSARAAGLRITTDMYTYPASSTGLDATMPTWVQEGGHEAWVARLKDPATRRKLLKEMRGDAGFDNAFVNAGGAEGILLVSFRNPALKPLTGKTLAEVAAMRGTSPEETAMDLVIEDDSRVGCVFFTMSEDNVRRKVQIPYMSFGSDGGSMSAEGVFLLSGTHPRAYGNFARLLGKYVREEQLLTLAEAVRRLTAQPADNLKLQRRGRLAPGAYADIVVFDPATIADRATFAEPHQYATGVSQVWVNGIQVLRDGEPTGAAAGRVVRGPGYRPLDSPVHP